MSVPTIQTVKGQVVFFRKECEKISALKPLTVWIFAAAISLTKTGNRILHPCPAARVQLFYLHDRLEIMDQSCYGNINHILDERVNVSIRAYSASTVAAQ